MQLLEKTFKLKEHKTTVLTEVVGGITTFFAMAYIIFVNPNFLSQTGMDHTAVMLATCISAAIGSLLTAFLANVPFAQAPGMGLNAFFTYTICFGMGYTWQQGLAIVFISGLIFLAVTVSPLRSKIIASIPASLKAAISAGIGLFICLIGLLNAGIVTAGNNLLDLSNITTGAPLLALIGLLLTGVLMAWKVKGALFIGIILTTLIGIPMGQTNVSNISISFEGISMAPTFFKLSFSGLFAMGVLPLLTAVITFAMCDCFDTVGTLLGTAGACRHAGQGRQPARRRPRADCRCGRHLRGRAAGHLHRDHLRRVLHRHFRGCAHRPVQRGHRPAVPAGLRAGAHRGHYPQRCHRPRADHCGHVHDRQRSQDRLEAIPKWRCPAS